MYPKHKTDVGLIRIEVPVAIYGFLMFPDTPATVKACRSMSLATPQCMLTLSRVAIGRRACPVSRSSSSLSAWAIDDVQIPIIPQDDSNNLAFLPLLRLICSLSNSFRKGRSLLRIQSMAQINGNIHCSANQLLSQYLYCC